MIAYNKKWLYNIYVKDQAAGAYYDGDITVNEHESINKAHPYFFYTPNLFVRVGLFLLTCIISVLTIGLFSLPFISGDIENTIAIITIIVGFGNYAALEFFARKKNHFNSGVDHAFMLITAACIIIGTNILSNITPLLNASIAGSIAIYFTIRFVDAFMGIVAFCAFVCVITFGIVSYAPVLKSFLPFLLLAFCCITLINIKYCRSINLRNYYSSVLLWLEVVTAISLYAFINFYVIKEVGNTLLNPANRNAPIPFAYIFWILTIIIPLIYLIYGVVKKNKLYIRVSLVCIAGMA